MALLLRLIYFMQDLKLFHRADPVEYDLSRFFKYILP